MGFWSEIPNGLFDDMKPREITAKELQRQLVDMYDFYNVHAYEMREAHEEDGFDDEVAYRIGHMEGGAEAIGALYLYFFGGRAMLELDQMIEEKFGVHDDDDE